MVPGFGQLLSYDWELPGRSVKLFEGLFQQFSNRDTSVPVLAIVQNVQKLDESSYVLLQYILGIPRIPRRHNSIKEQHLGLRT